MNRGAWLGYRPKGPEESDMTEQMSTHMAIYKVGPKRGILILVLRMRKQIQRNCLSLLNSHHN